MMLLPLFLLLSLLFPAIFGIRCYDNSQIDDPTQSSPLVTCENGQDICLIKRIYALDIKGNPVGSPLIRKSCSSSSIFFGVKNKCVSFTNFVRSVDKCICDKDECNDSLGGGMGLLTVLLIAIVVVVVLAFGAMGVLYLTKPELLLGLANALPSKLPAGMPSFGRKEPEVVGGQVYSAENAAYEGNDNDDNEGKKDDVDGAGMTAVQLQ